MIPRRDKREGALFRLECQSRPLDGPPRLKGQHFDLADIADAWKKAIVSKKATQYFDPAGKECPGPWKPGFSQVRLHEVVANADANGKFRSYTLLFSFANAKAADPGRRDLVKDTVDVMHLGKDGALDFGAHLVIGERTATGKFVNTYRCVLEDMNGLGRSRVTRLLETLAREYIAADKRPTIKKVIKKVEHAFVGNPKLMSYAEKSSKMQELIEEGRLTGVQFLSATSKGLSDELPSELAVEEMVLSAKVISTKAKGNRAAKILEKAADFARKRKWRMKAEIELEKDDERHPIVRPFDLDATDLGDQLYARREPLNVSGDLSQCYDKINQAVTEALHQILDHQPHWT